MKKIVKIILVVSFILLPISNTNATSINQEVEIQNYVPEKAYVTKTVRSRPDSIPDSVYYKKFDGQYLYEGRVYYKSVLYIDDNGLGVFLYGGYVNKYPKDMIMR